MPHRTGVDRYGSHVLDRRRDPEAERGEHRARPATPAPPLQFGTLGWASAVGNQAVARAARAGLAREVAEEEPTELDTTPEGDVGAEAPPEMEAEPESEGPALEDLPEELPE
jgi:hypothetical protein